MLTTAVLGRVVPLQPRRNAPRLGRGEGLAGHAGVVRVEVVADQDHLLGLREVHVHQVAQDGGEIELGAPGRDLDRAPALLGGRYHEQVADPVAPVLVSRPIRLAKPRSVWIGAFARPDLLGRINRALSSRLARALVAIVQPQDPGTAFPGPGLRSTRHVALP